jgi:hypothetical protein
MRLTCRPSASLILPLVSSSIPRLENSSQVGIGLGGCNGCPVGETQIIPSGKPRAFTLVDAPGCFMNALLCWVFSFLVSVLLLDLMGAILRTFLVTEVIGA